ncbi:MAG: HAD family hydrolase [Oscillospiraceae bacterium]|nr:HAD family hydrolase [Oscillospiraceae bacterium]
MSTHKLAVFDLDGTLNRTELYAVPAHHMTLRDLGFPDRSDEDIISVFGARAQESVRFLTGRDEPALVDEYMRISGSHERELIKDSAASFDGVPRMLSQLKADGYDTAICSNSSERYIRMVLEALSISQWIDYIQPLIPDLTKEDTLRLLLEREKPPAAVMVGDRFYDKDAAQANGLPFIGCLYGFCPDEVRDGDAAVESPLDINDAVRRLIG